MAGPSARWSSTDRAADLVTSRDRSPHLFPLPNSWMWGLAIDPQANQLQENLPGIGFASRLLKSLFFFCWMCFSNVFGASLWQLETPLGVSRKGLHQLLCSQTLGGVETKLRSASANELPGPRKLSKSL